ncbi:MAG: hypothetical protein JW729_09160 [Bacteroidales bacterium]|nr:hypothetical protein [Bacteroidales bacterium]
MNEQIQNQENPIERPQLITTLAIISFIGSGWSFFSYLITSLTYNAVVLAMQNSLEMDLPKSYLETFQLVNDFVVTAGRSFFVLGTLAYAGSLFGVYKMWNMQKQGLHYYTISQLIILILPLLFVSTRLSVVPGLLLTALFVLLYARGLKMIGNEK